MQVDLDNTPSPKWSLTVKFRGVEHATRAILSKDADELRRLVSARPIQPAALRRAIKEHFVRPLPDVDSMRAESLYEIATALMMEYYRYILAAARTAVE